MLTALSAAAGTGSSTAATGSGSLTPALIAALAAFLTASTGALS